MCDQGNQDTLPVIVRLILLVTKLLREINDQRQIWSLYVDFDENNRLKQA